jgi:hypothetical protein
MLPGEVLLVHVYVRYHRILDTLSSLYTAQLGYMVTAGRRGMCCLSISSQSYLRTQDPLSHGKGRYPARS